MFTGFEQLECPMKNSGIFPRLHAPALFSDQNFSMGLSGKSLIIVLNMSAFFTKMTVLKGVKAVFNAAWTLHIPILKTPNKKKQTGINEKLKERDG